LQDPRTGLEKKDDRCPAGSGKEKKKKKPLFLFYFAGGVRPALAGKSGNRDRQNSSEKRKRGRALSFPKEGKRNTKRAALRRSAPEKRRHPLSEGEKGGASCFLVFNTKKEKGRELRSSNPAT